MLFVQTLKHFVSDITHHRGYTPRGHQERKSVREKNWKKSKFKMQKQNMNRLSNNINCEIVETSILHAMHHKWINSSNNFWILNNGHNSSCYCCVFKWRGLIKDFFLFQLKSKQAINNEMIVSWASCTEWKKTWRNKHVRQQRGGRRKKFVTEDT